CNMNMLETTTHLAGIKENGASKKSDDSLASRNGRDILMRVKRKSGSNKSGRVPKVPPYKNPALPAEKRVGDLLRRMTIEEKAAQMMCVWQQKVKKLVDEHGDFDLGKAQEAFKDGCGIGQVGRPSDAGAPFTQPELGRNARQMAELTNAIQKFFIE